MFCASIKGESERIFFHLAHWTETQLITDKSLTVPPTCCLIFNIFLWLDTMSAEVRAQLLLPWVGFGLASWGRGNNSSWSHGSVLGICFPQMVRVSCAAGKWKKRNRQTPYTGFFLALECWKIEFLGDAYWETCCSEKEGKIKCSVSLKQKGTEAATTLDIGEK